ncbi:hypothetical protein [Nocardioides cynanchi]|uniref:hypothetical protein n=1 Tax=Nocardioides cynanchi TaxID=2558918 RepID=UPI0012469903|nr:hypothetical protein [Nocardioides cynanchi]
MAADLRDRLGDLAGATPPGAPPNDLWSRGVRRRRVGQAGTALLVAVLVLLVGVGGWAWHSARVVAPADPGSVTQVPDRLFPPSPWLHSYDGPPGRLIAVIPAIQRTFWHEQNGYVGVTAATGHYGFLHLPRRVPDLTFADPVSLSPDGRRLAVWVTGRVRGRPNSPAPVSGLDVHDLVTGAVQRWRPPTVHGLSTDRLTWAGGDTLLVDVGQYVHGAGSPDEGAAVGYRTYRWDLPSGRPEPLPESLQDLNSTATGHRLVTYHARSALVTDLDGQAAPVRVTWAGAQHQPMSVNPSGSRLVGLQGQGNNGNLVTGRIPAGGGALLGYQTLTVGRSRHAYAVDGWLDDHHAIVEVGVTGADARGELDSVDVRTGRVRPLIGHFVLSQVATDLLTGPSVHASPPSSPPDPRKVLGWSVALAILLGLVTLVVRGTRVSRP